MHKPTSAERKTILAALPKPPEGKVWKQYSENETIRNGFVVAFTNGMVGYKADIRKGMGFYGFKGIQLQYWESCWHLVAARKRPKTVYYRKRHDANYWTSKIVGNKDFVYRNDPKFPYETFGDGMANTARSMIADGTYVSITRAEFLARIKSYGLNEDGTKIVAPAPAPEATMNDVWAAFCAYTAQSGNGMHHLKLYDDKSGQIVDCDETVLDFAPKDGFAGIVAKIKAATR